MGYVPRCMAMGRHSLPHTDVRKACEVILRSYPESVVLPDLWLLLPEKLRLSAGVLRVCQGMPCLVVDEAGGRIYFDTSDRNRLNEEMAKFYEQYLAGNVDFFAPNPAFITGELAMLEMLAKSPPPELKVVQVAGRGPITFGLQMTDQNRRPAFYDEALRDAIVKARIMNSKWWLRKVREAVPQAQVIMSIGEAGLQSYGSAFVSLERGDIISVLNEVSAELDCLIAIHCCGNTDWGILAETDIDIIDFDAYNFVEKIALFAPQLLRFLERGGSLAWGIVPNTNEGIEAESLPSLVDRLEAGLTYLEERGLPRRLLLNSCLVTTSCVTDRTSIENAERAASLVKAISQSLRQKYSLTN